MTAVRGEGAPPLIAAVEAGGTKFEIMVARERDRPLATRRIPTSEPGPTLAEASAFLRQCAQELGQIEAIGIAAFGPVRVRDGAADWGLIGRTPKPGWTGTDLIAPFAGIARHAIALDTDVNCAAVGESRHGAARGLADVAYVTVGTGLGVGLVLNGRPRHGMLHPEAGHIPLRRRPGDTFHGTCPFHGDCAEGLLSGPAVRERLGHDLDMGSASDADLDVFTDYLGQLCATVILTTSVQRIVIGGGVMAELHVHDLVEDRTRHWLGDYLELPPAPDRLVVSPGLRGRSGIVGAFSIASDLLLRETGQS